MDAREQLKRREEQRYAVLRWVHDDCGGRMNYGYELGTIAEALSITEDEARSAAEYLLNKGLLGQDFGMGTYNLTHEGLVEVEDSIREPTVATENFQPSTIMNFHGPIGSVQTGDHNVAHVTQNILTDNRVTSLVQQLHQLAQEAPADKRADATEAAEELERQVSAPKPKRVVIRSLLGTLSTFLTSPAAVPILAELMKWVDTALVHSQ